MGISDKKRFELYPIGYIRYIEDNLGLEVLEDYCDGLEQLSNFSHIIVLWWASETDKLRNRQELQTIPPYAHDNIVGIFATRAPYRPNPIGMTVCEIVSIKEKEGIIQVSGIDAFEGTPIIDLKPYIPICDRVQDVELPDWLPAEWTDWWEPEDE